MDTIVLPLPEFIDKQKENKVFHQGRANLRPCKPGETHNPYGRPKLEKTFSHIAREMLKSKVIDITYTFPKDGVMRTSKMHMESDKTMNHSLAAVLIKEGMAGNVKAIQEIIDRTEGKPNQKVDITTNNESLNKPCYSFEGKDPEELRKVRDVLQKAKTHD